MAVLGGGGGGGGEQGGGIGGLLPAYQSPVLHVHACHRLIQNKNRGVRH